MGHSTRFAARSPPLNRAGITQLEREPLSHSTPGRVNDHICIGMVKMLRWLADRAFRERYVHRATMLLTVAAAAPAAGSVVAYLRMFFKRRRSHTVTTQSGTGHSDAGHGAAHESRARTTVAAEASSPFLPFAASAGATASGAATASRRSFGSSARPSLHAPATSAGAAADGAGATLAHSYVGELRGLLTQCESHAVHYQVLSCMAEIAPLERGLVLLLQAVHFAVYFALFLFYPRMGFRLMAYTAEESSVVWTQMVNDIDLGKIAELRVPHLALQYWGLEGVFTAQAALVPMVVPPRPAEVVVFKPDPAPPRVASEVTSEGDAGSAAVFGVTGNTDPTSPAPPVGSKATTTTATAGAVPSPTPTEPYTTHDEAPHEEREEEMSRPSDAAADAAASVLTLRDVVLLIRSDEMVFRDLNHEIANELDLQPGWLQRFFDSASSDK